MNLALTNSEVLDACRASGVNMSEVERWVVREKPKAWVGVATLSSGALLCAHGSYFGDIAWMVKGYKEDGSDVYLYVY